MNREKTIALVAHDNIKSELVDWVQWNRDELLRHKLICTGTTGRMVTEVLARHAGEATPDIVMLKSGPLGGDQQLGSKIAEGYIDALIFFWDPMQAQPHDVDVKALLRLATLYNVPTAVNRASADFLISSPLFGSDYEPTLKDYSHYIERTL